MSTPLSEKFEKIRKAEALNQKEFAEQCDIVYGTYRNYEADVRQPNTDALKKVCEAFPEYTVYLMLDNMPENESDKQITPEKKMFKD